MPKFLELYGWRFFAVMFDLLNEPFHIHVTDKGRKECKYWVTQTGATQLAFNRGFTERDLRKIEKAIVDNLTVIINQYKFYHAVNNPLQKAGSFSAMCLRTSGTDFYHAGNFSCNGLFTAPILLQ